MTYPDASPAEDTSDIPSGTAVADPPTNTNDVPLASVNGFGPSELLTYIVVLGGLLTSLFGHDWGVSKNAQAIAVLVAGIVTAVHSLARAWKHHSVSLANATVIAAQVAATGQSITNVVNSATPVPKKRATKSRLAADAGATLLYVIGIVLAVVGALLLLIGAAHGVLSVTGVIVLVIGAALVWFDGSSRGGRRVL